MQKFLFLLFLFSCDSKEVNKVVSSFNNGKPKIIEYYKIILKDSILVKKQELHNNGILKYETIFNNNLSECSSYSINGRIEEEKFFTNNQLDSIINYNKDGSILSIKYNLD